LKFITNESTDSPPTEASNKKVLWVTTGSTDFGTEDPALYANEFGRNGVTCEDFTFRPSIEWKMPYYNNLVYIVNNKTRFDDETQTVRSYYKVESYAGSNVTSTVKQFISIGDDFAFGWPKGAPIIHQIIPNTPKLGTSGNRDELKPTFSLKSKKLA